MHPHRALQAWTVPSPRALGSLVPARDELRLAAREPVVHTRLAMTADKAVRSPEQLQSSVCALCASAGFGLLVKPGYSTNQSGDKIGF